MRSEYNYK
jgi:hypothetical protein